MPIHRVGSRQEFGETHDYGTQINPYEGPHGAGTSYQKGYRTSFETSGGAFTTSNLMGKHLAGLGGQNRSGLVKWEGDTEPPAFKSA